MNATDTARFDEIGLRLLARAIAVRTTHKLIVDAYRMLGRTYRFWREGGSGATPTVAPGERIVADVGLIRGDYILVAADPARREDIAEIAETVDPVDPTPAEARGTAPRRPTNENGARRAA